MSSPAISRPGISPELLAAAGVVRVDGKEAMARVGYEASGILIPYINRNGDPVMVNGVAFARLRLDIPTSSAKYLSPRSSGCQLYEPHGIRRLLVPGCTLTVVEGEFKALSLVEVGVPAVGIGGIQSACPGGEILPALAEIIQEVRPAKLAFLGDSDTSLIFDFSREAAKIADLAGVPVELPRIPLDAPGKGPDDLRAVWGDQFGARWAEICAAAEPVEKSENPPSLALRLLRREAGALSRLDGGDLEKAQGRIVRMLSAIEGNAIIRNQILSIAVESLRLPKSVLLDSVKEEKREQKERTRAQREEHGKQVVGADGEDPLYFDGAAYWRREADDAYGRLCREDARLHLGVRGFNLSSLDGMPSPADYQLHALQYQNRVNYAGPVCGRPAGLLLENGLRVLVTRAPKFIEGWPDGDSPTITALMANLFGHAAGDEHAGRQCQLFIAWLKLAREAIRTPGRHQPGQIMVFVGPPDCGKSLLQTLIITPALGNRSADPGLFFTGRTDFNADLWGAEHLALGDKPIADDGVQRNRLRDELKRVAASTDYPLHGKHKDALTMRPIWRVSLSVNDDQESVNNLPSLDAAFADKAICLRCYQPPQPFFDANVVGARERFAELLRKELPAFLGEVDRFLIPSELAKARFGVCEWHHPYVVELLAASDPLQPLSEAMQAWVDSWPTDVFKEMPAVQLYHELDNHHEGRLARSKISTGPRHLGHQLARLAVSADCGWVGRIHRADRRIGGRARNQRQTLWRVQKEPSL